MYPFGDDFKSPKKKTNKQKSHSLSNDLLWLDFPRFSYSQKFQLNEKK
jgi:hypothetical protein